MWKDSSLGSASVQGGLTGGPVRSLSTHQECSSPRNLLGSLPPHLCSNKDFPDPLFKILPHSGTPHSLSLIFFPLEQHNTTPPDI